MKHGIYPQALNPLSFEDNLFPSGSEILVSEYSGGEARCVAISYKEPNFVQVYERSEGPLTQEVFQTPWHAHLVSVNMCELKAFFSCSGPAETLTNVSLFFLLFDRYLTEFMDFLEDNFIPYRYELEVAGSPPAQRFASA